MASVHRRSRHRRHLTALDWPSTPEVDGCTRELGPEPTDPSEADGSWAAANLNDLADADGPSADDPIWDVWADEADALDRIQRGYCL